MSGSDSGVPTAEDLRAVQTWLTHLDGLSESDPARVLDESADALELLATWTSSDAYAWALALRAKAFRLLDDLDSVLATVDTALGALHGEEPVAAHLHLEAGMALNQFGHQANAEPHLRDADRIFGATGDDDGRAWALISLAECQSGNGYQDDPLPMLRMAIAFAEDAGDDRARRRAWKQLAVVYRHRGVVDSAMEAIQEALTGQMSEHSRANNLLELGHLLAWSGDFASADDAYQDAAVIYAAHQDTLGEANTERALAYNALILGRHREGLTRLDRALTQYRLARNTPGVGYVLRERALVRLFQDDPAGAASDINEGLAAFREGSDRLGLAGMLRAAARVASVSGDDPTRFLEEGLRLTDDGGNPLAQAGILTLQAETDSNPKRRFTAARGASDLYRELRVPSGEALAGSLLAREHAALGRRLPALQAIREASAALRRARLKVVDPGRRADHDFALGDITTNLLETCISIGEFDAITAAADLVVDEAPLGLRQGLTGGAIGDRVARYLRRVSALPVRSDGAPDAQRYLLQQLAATITIVDPEDFSWVSFAELANAHPDQTLVAIGAPTRNGDLPVTWRVKGSDPAVSLVPLTRAQVEQIDTLREVRSTDSAGPLWSRLERGWQTELTNVFLPEEIRMWLLEYDHPQLAILLPSALAHVPLEALLLEDIPIGVRAAVTRLPAPTVTVGEAQIGRAVAFLDPALPWGPEKSAMLHFTTYPEGAKTMLGPERLILLACHGEAASGLAGSLVTESGSRVVDAIDILSQSLASSVVVLEACYSGRYFGTRSGEQLSLASVSLLAGASDAIAGLFALPADDNCTGRIVGTLLRELQTGASPAEALRRARADYWLGPPVQLDLPGAPGSSMPADAPWAWAGLVAYAR
jgi:tetratricopeptide (TPR) repeat protein